ncbi:MAG: TetR/AcrR family transcriptional regulator [Chloroflexi bacterium]|nr:TetR/AcrR family transcriptional regulator [Chloroflexota bacterium]
MSEGNYHHGDLKNALIQVGVEILAEEGLGRLSLRKVAKQAGVSHAAPYSHFKDKQALIAAISTESFKELHIQIETVFLDYKENPKDLLVETSWAYLQFALTKPDQFKLMFSSVLEKEKKYPDFVEISHLNFQQLLIVVEICQDAKILKSGQASLTAVSLWSAVHGLAMLVLEGQISSVVLEEHGLKEIFLHSLNQIALVELK